MNTRTKRPETPERTKRDVYQEVTDRLIGEMERGDVPWMKPWEQLPQNLSTGRLYSGINVFLLWAQAFEEGYGNPYWLTFQNAMQMGGNVRKGEKATQIVLYKEARKSKIWMAEERKRSGKRVGEIEDTYLYARYYHVFNVAQCDGIHYQEHEPQHDFGVAQQWIDTLKAEKGLKTEHSLMLDCHYSHTKDLIRMPGPEAFTSLSRYWTIVCHEVMHWSANRVGRTLNADKSSQEYRFEELVAEMGAGLLMAHMGLASAYDAEQSAAYLNMWLGSMKQDKKFVFSAASKARQAVEFLMSTKGEQEEDGQE